MNALEGTTGSRRLPVEILAEHEVKALIRANSTRAPTGVRNRALLAPLYRSGLRISEALALELRDLDPHAGTLNVRHGKGDRQRIVGMDDDAFALLEIWLERRRKLGLGRRPAVFCTYCLAWPSEQSFHPTSECTPTPCATPTPTSYWPRACAWT